MNRIASQAWPASEYFGSAVVAGARFGGRLSAVAAPPPQASKPQSAQPAPVFVPHRVPGPFYDRQPFETNSGSHAYM